MVIEGVLVIVAVGGFIGSLLCSRLFAVLSIMFLSSRLFLYSQYRKYSGLLLCICVIYNSRVFKVLVIAEKHL